MTTAEAQVFAPFRAFLRWWVDELVGLVPASLSHLSLHPERLVVLLGPADAMLFLESPRAVTALGSIAFGGQADPRSQLHSILRQRGVARALSRGRLGVWVRLPANQALRTTI